MDIGVKRKTGPQEESVGIVMKRDLTNLADLRLLMEQIDHAGKTYQELFVILMGTLTPDMEAKLSAFLANKGAGAKITVVKK
jgi:predicted RNase H-like nuclease (RuvC/YqgF family)